ncbi:TonB-dependent receptor [Shewanella sp. WXL01]|uniref:TonB-dependent receptor plug domain-containing protein n=1 Tax=Shewanella sp. WXL01 TaxID=2709721 RepID=UPI00143832E7|nr:TonB-dependent receptor plug domain-containing protein [Shewanella sp. WXL01]NKF49125.1 TonB-dependent receptor [Shewanella sp. WXL01]
MEFKLNPVYASIVLASTLTMPFSAYAEEGDSFEQQQQEILTQTKKTPELWVTCATKMRFPEAELLSYEKAQRMEACLNNDGTPVEVIEVTGRYFGPEVLETQGRIFLSQDFIENAPVGNGDITELLKGLPGIQSNEADNSIASLTDIRSREVSISGGKAYQNGFFIDGMNTNSRIDPASSGLSADETNSVMGHTNEFFLNKDLVESITVYDSNIPVEYGEFMGGVVESQSKDAWDLPSVSFGYRATQSDWVSFHDIYGEGDDPSESVFEKPVYDKKQYKLQLAKKLGKGRGIGLNVNHTESTKSIESLGELVDTSSTNSNVMLKYDSEQDWFDHLSVSALYAPYKGNYILDDTLNSDYSIEGGGYALNATGLRNLGWADWKITANARYSENSRTAPIDHVIWGKYKGKDWGPNDSTVSKEGGNGDLDNGQVTYSLNNKFDFDTSFWELDHQFTMGLQLESQQVTRDRNQDSVRYSNAAVKSNVDCTGNFVACVEQESLSEEELSAILGEPFDDTNPEHIRLREENVVTTGQFLQKRLIYQEEHIDVTVRKGALYVQDVFEVGDWNFNLGLRYDTEDFFKNHNVSPRFSGGYDLFGDNQTLITFGASRYYDANLTTYAIREQQLPYITQTREVTKDGQLTEWTDANSQDLTRYRYDGVKTPYSDELTLGWKQEMLGGFLSLRGVWRKSKDELGKGDSVREGGYTYIYQVNKGESEQKRISLSWNGQYKDHSFWANTSWSQTETTQDSYDGDIDDTPQDQIVAHETTIINAEGKEETVYTAVSLDDLDRIAANYARPWVVNMGWTAKWTDDLQTTLTAKYTQGYTSVAATSNVHYFDDITVENESGELIPLEATIYREFELDDAILLNASVRYRLPDFHKHRLSLSVDISNLLDSRTYSVLPGNSGVEVGRSFWLGINYQYD